MKNEIDFVQLWVDGSDKEWLLEKSKYQPGLDVDASARRYRSWDNLQYWFRGVEKFAPWVRKVHFVTCGHYPAWLNKEHPKLNLVKHSDFIPSQYLPTFNSSPIVLNVHRIKGLLDTFVLFNDDSFILKPLKKTDFFKDNLPRDRGIIQLLYATTEFSYILFNNMYIINKHFNKIECIRKHWSKWFNYHYGVKNIIKNMILSYVGQKKDLTGIQNIHLPLPYKIESINNIWKTESDLLDKASKNKFRCKKDLSDWLFRYWRVMQGQFHPGPCLGKNFGIENNEKKNILIYNTIKKQKYKLISVNDVDNDIAFEHEKQKLKEALEYILPDKSGFEL